MYRWWRYNGLKSNGYSIFPFNENIQLSVLVVLLLIRTKLLQCKHCCQRKFGHQIIKLLTILTVWRSVSQCMYGWWNSQFLFPFRHPLRCVIVWSLNHRCRELIYICFFTFSIYFGLQFTKFEFTVNQLVLLVWGFFFGFFFLSKWEKTTCIGVECTVLHVLSH